MTTFIRGNDTGFILLKTLIILFFIFLLLLSVLELEHRKHIRTKIEYEQAVLQYEKAKEEDFTYFSIRRF